MKVLVIGSGGREHALVWKLRQSPLVTELYCAPGNAGIEQVATCISLAADDVAGLRKFVQTEGISLTVVGPEAPLAAGIADDFRRSKLRIFGPSRNAARIESSKSFAKELMVRQGIPTAASKTFADAGAARSYIQRQPLPVVIKADGLAQGKGVIVATTREQAMGAITDILDRRVFGEAGGQIVIEEFLDGEELTVMAFTDGKTVVPMVAAQDHKRVGDGDSGPNTGGMGAYAPAPLGTRTLLHAVEGTVLRPVVEALSRVGSPFQGVLYAGMMIVRGKPYVLEFNARFGDPETEVVLPLLKTDLAEVLLAVTEHRLDQCTIEWQPGAAVCVVLTSGGYPGSYATGLPIRGLPPPGEGAPDAVVFHAGTKRQGHQIVTAGGRVLAVSGIASSLRQARDQAYQLAQAITFEGRHLRSDIAARALLTTQ